jgi:hypothetical protein
LAWLNTEIPVLDKPSGIAIPISNSDNALLFSALTYLANNCARYCMMNDLNLPDFNWDLFIHPDNELYNSASGLTAITVSLS